jgi:hypothetical protein
MGTNQFLDESPHFISRKTDRVGSEVPESMIQIDVIPHDCNEKAQRERLVSATMTACIRAPYLQVECQPLAY